MKIFQYCFATACAIIFSAGLGGCIDFGFDDDTIASTSRTFVGTQAPGDVWTMTLTDTSFTATNVTKSFTYSGSLSALPSGFKKLTISSSNDPAVGVGAVGFLVEQVNTAVQIFISEQQPPIVATIQGSCPTAAATYNWVTIPGVGWDFRSSTAFGSATSTITGSIFDFALTNNRVDGTPNPAGASNGWTCSGGVFTRAGTETINATPSGAIIQDGGPNAGGFIGVTRPAAQLTPAELAGKMIIGMQWSTATSPPSEIGAGIFDETGNKILPQGLDTETGGMAPKGEAITLTYTATPGLITGTSPSFGGRPFVLIANRIGSDYIIYAVSRQGGGQPFNLILVEKK